MNKPPSNPIPGAPPLMRHMLPQEFAALIEERAKIEVYASVPTERPRLVESGIPEHLFESFSTR